MDCGRGEIGRRTRLRIWRREAWGFESLRPHPLKNQILHGKCSADTKKNASTR